jgi:hypothetical protein
MMKTLLAAGSLAATLALAGPAFAQAPGDACEGKEVWPAAAGRHIPVAKELLGSWELVKLEQVDEAGKPLAAGSAAQVSIPQPDAGEITLFPDGRIFVLMSRRDRAEKAKAGGATDPLAGFFSMRGTYVFKCGLLTYTPELASDVRREKIPFRRWAQLEGPDLYLRTAREQTGTYWILHWKRIG